MLVLTFQVDGRQNCVTVEGTPYVFARTVLGSFVLRARCAHRGGPLHLARLDADRVRLICPWHGRGTSIAPSLRRDRGVPAVRRGNRVTAVFAVTADAAHSLEHRPLSADLQVAPVAADGGQV